VRWSPVSGDEDHDAGVRRQDGARRRNLAGHERNASPRPLIRDASECAAGSGDARLGGSRRHGEEPRHDARAPPIRSRGGPRSAAEGGNRPKRRDGKDRLHRPTVGRPSGTGAARSGGPPGPPCVYPTARDAGRSTSAKRGGRGGGGGIRTHEPLWGQRFSRPPRSTAPAPRRAGQVSQARLPRGSVTPTPRGAWHLRHETVTNRAAMRCRRHGSVTAPRRDARHLCHESVRERPARARRTASARPAPRPGSSRGSRAASGPSSRCR
jgi:hypothetical protein